MLSIDAQIKQSEQYKLDQMQSLNVKKSKSMTAAEAEEPVWLPSFIEIQSDEEE